MQSSKDSTARVIKFPAPDERPVLVPPGEYDLAFTGFETWTMFQRAPKLTIWFTIAEPGEGFGQRVARYYNVIRLIGNRGRGGQFKVGGRSDFIRDYARLFSELPRRLDRIPMTRFENRVIRGMLRTVQKDHRQRELHELVQYSVVADLLGVMV